MSAPVLIAPGVYRFPTLGDFINTIAFVEDDGSVTLVDCGIKQAPPKIVAALKHIGKAPQDVQKIVLSHAHPDHAGGAAEMVTKTGIDGVDVSEEDAGYATSGRSPDRDAPRLIAQIFTRLGTEKFPPVPVANRLVDGQLIEIAGGLRVFHTPGHTPGHLSFVHEPTRTLITGDSIWNMASRMTWPVPMLCTSFELTKKTAHVLGELEYDTAVFTHGPEISKGAREAVRGFLKRKHAW